MDWFYKKSDEIKTRKEGSGDGMRLHLGKVKRDVVLVIFELLKRTKVPHVLGAISNLALSEESQNPLSPERSQIWPPLRDLTPSRDISGLASPGDLKTHSSLTLPRGRRSGQTISETRTGPLQHCLRLTLNLWRPRQCQLPHRHLPWRHLPQR